MKKVLFLIGAMLLSMGAWAQQYDTDFVQTRIMKVSGKTTTMEGHITFDGGDQLTMNYSDPEGEYFIIDGNQVKINLLKKKAELDADKVPAVKLQRATLLNCLKGNWEEAASDNNAETTISEQDGYQTVYINAKEHAKIPRGGYSSVELTYRLSDHLVTRMVLEELTGVKNIYELK